MISEEQRERWREWRDRLSLGDPLSDRFGSLQPAIIEEPARVRMLITPPDPVHDFINFDTAFWDWWSSDRPDPVNGDRQTQWGFVKTPSADAALRTPGDPRTERRRYLALYRNAAQEVGLYATFGGKPGKKPQFLGWTESWGGSGQPSRPTRM